MRTKIARLRRIAATGFAFAIFGLAGLVAGLGVLPIVRAFPGSSREKDFRCQRVVGRFFRLYLRMAEGLGLMDVGVHHGERLRAPGQLVVANHPTLLDVVFVIAQMPQADCVVKSAVTKNPFMRSVARCAGYLSNELEADLVDACAERLRDGRSLVLFPEGTRSPREELGTFQRGAAHIALRSGVPFRPVVIRCDPPGLMRGQKWYDVADRPFDVSITCADPIYVEDSPAGGRGRGAAARRATAELRDFFAKRLQTPEG